MKLKLNTSIGSLLFILLATFLCSALTAQATLSGTITDKDQEGLIGASVFVTGTSTGTVTDYDGAYSLSIPAGTYTIRFSYTGYRTMEKSFTFTDGQTVTENVTLEADNLSLDEVVVTGSFTGRTQKASPMSITLINAEQLQRLSSNSQADILRGVPGITAEGGGGEVASNIFVRGLPSGGQYQFTPLQVDGMPVLSTFGLNSSAHDVYFRNDIGIRNLEFTRGGSSTLFGAGSVAGIINYTSITGTATPDNKVQLEWAEGGRAKLDILSSGPLADNLFYAVSGFYRYDEGPLKTGLATRGHQIRANIKKLFNEGKSSFTVYAQSIDDNVQFYLPYPLANDAGQSERPVGNDGETVFTTLTDQAAGYSFDTPYGRFESPIADGVTTKGGYIMAQLNHSFDNDWRLSAKAKSAKYEHGFNLFLDGDGVRNVPEGQDTYLSNRDLPADATFTYVDDGTELAAGDLLFENRILDRDRPMEETVGEIQLTKTAGNHSFSFGTFVSDTRAEDNNWISNFLGDFRNAPRTVNLTYTNDMGEEVSYSTGGFIDGRQTANRHHRSTKVAFYAGDQYQGERFSLDVGLRWENATGKIVREDGVGSNNFQKGTVSASDFAVAVAGLYKVNPDLNIYANASRGYFFPELRGVGFSAPGSPLSYEPETIIQGELGAKYGKNKLAATAALYYVNLSDRRNVDFINDPNNPGSVIEQVRLQSTRTVGVEASLNYSVSDDLNLYGNVTLQDHEFTKVEGNEDQVGNELRRQPNAIGLIGANYDNGSIDAGLSANLLGSKFANDANTVELEGYNIVRLDGGYTFDLGKKQTMRLGFQVSNLFDSDGVTEGSPRQADSQSGGISDFFVGRPILPRRLFVRVSFDF
ncbi:TonB-dependent receptor [Neolewinella aurantiaca]|uniref:TonB-dependent receptor n=1 Tax=Neolewinella aurantiaca TaxID=2602767 RepID=A0A5C7FK97_9BACT|nr:TonB-dependent receptor [Neolewinella aurantiaca]TXF90301.1 TonB-dependent receptor [Neolewinella aurantiaca]